MADKILKGLRLPGGKDTYIITPETAKDLNTPNAAAESKMVGTAIQEVNNSLALKADKDQIKNDLALKADKIHTHTKSQVGLDKVDNTADKDKSVAYAETAGTASANDVSAWAKADTKPSYSANEVGAYTKAETNNQINGTWHQKKVTLSSSSWNDNYYTITGLVGLTSSSLIFASADGNSTDSVNAFRDNNIWACEQGNEYVKFCAYDGIPSSTIYAIIAWNTNAII